MDRRLTYAVIVVVGYLLGSVSFARVVTALRAPGADVADLTVQLRESQELVPVGVVGANAASMLVGARYGVVAALLDILKVALPALVLRWLQPVPYAHLVVALSGLLGHNWPVYYRFRGGRGYSVLLGGLLVAAPVGVIVSLLLANLIGLGLLANPPLAYGLWLPVMVLWAVVVRRDWVLAGFVVLVLAIFAIATLPEIRMVMRYRREGRYEAYMDAMMRSSPRWRGTVKLMHLLRFWEKH
jgi:glycerol-3-phosphate acyltransferase PlsY